MAPLSEIQKHLSGLTQLNAADVEQANADWTPSLKTQQAITDSRSKSSVRSKYLRGDYALSAKGTQTTARSSKPKKNAPSKGISDLIAGGALGDQINQNIQDAASTGDVGGVAFGGVQQAIAPLAQGVAPLFVDQGKAQAPQNAGQWLMNLMGTGIYAGARAAEGAGAATAKYDKPTRDANKRGDFAGAVGQQAASFGEGAVNVVGGTARGLAEGVGMRFDGERPRTWGQNFEAVGSKKLLQGALGKDAGNFAQGALGTIADVGLDPATYLTLGATGVLKGASKGISEGTSTLSKLGRGIKGGVVDGPAARRAELAAARATRVENKAIIKADKINPDAEYVPKAHPFDAAAAAPAAVPTETPRLADLLNQADTAARRPGAEPTTYENPAGFEEWLARGDTSAPAVPAAKAAPIMDPVSVPSAVPSELGTAAGRQANIDELLPSLTGRADDLKVPAAKILKDATVAVPSQIVDDGVHQAITDTILSAGDISNPRAFREGMTALEANPKTKEFLDLSVKVGDTTQTIREMIRYEARQAARGTMDDSKMPLIEQALAAGRSMESKITPEAFAAAIQKHMPALGADLDSGAILTRMLEMDAKGQKKFLAQALNLPGTRNYATFQDALDGALAGRVDGDQMRSMLGALGINTTAVGRVDLRAELAGAGTFNWERIQAGLDDVPTVNAAHEVTPELDAAADAVDLEQVTAEMVDEAARDMDQYVGFDATKIVPSGGSITGNAIHDAVTELGRLFKDGNPVTVYNDDAAIAMNKVVLTTLAKPYQKASGAIRAERIYPRYLEALTVIESHFRSLGMIPRFADRRSANTLYVSFGQIVGNLPEDVAKLALFSPMRARPGFGAEKEIGFVNGFTLYPNHLGNGTKLALRAMDNGVAPEEAAVTVRALLLKQATEAWKGTGHAGVPTWAGTTEGNAALDQVAAALTNPDYLGRIRAINDQMAPVAVALTKKAAADIVQPLGARIVDALTKGADRGALQAIIDDAWKVGTKAAAPPAGIDATLLSDLVRQRLDHAIINGVLGENGALIVKADKRTAAAAARPAAAVATERQAKVTAEQAARAKAGKAAPTKAAGDTQAARSAQAKAKTATLADAEPSLQAALDDIHPGTRTVDEILDDTSDVIDGEEFARVMTYDEILSDLTGSQRLFKHINVGQSGKAGQLELHALRVASEENSFTLAAEYASDTRKWVTGLRQRLQPILGLNARASVDDTMAFITRTWEALAHTDPAIWADEDALRAALAAGGEMDAARNITGGFDALSPAEIDIAIELRQFINLVHAPELAGTFARSGLTTADVAAQAFRLPEQFKAFMPDPGEADLAAHAQNWRNFGQSGSPLDVLASMHQAVSAATVSPSIGASLSHIYGHSNMAKGVSRAQLYKEGWRRLDPKTAASGIQNYVDPDEMFHPAIRAQLTYVNHYLESSRSFASNVGFNTYVVKPYDAVMHVLKSSNTIWRLGHHVTNVLGEFAMLLMAGVNPLQSIRAVHAIRAGGNLLDADLGPLTRTLTIMGHNGKVADPKFGEQFVSIVLTDAAGKKTVQRIPLSEVWTRGINDGSALTHTAARDLQDDLPARLGSTKAQAFANNNPLAKTDEALGKFSAVRDNVTRLAHYIHELEAGQYGNLDEAFMAAARKVQDFHPTMRTLSATEQKYNRRIFFFYSWMRQAISRVVRTGLDNPGFVTMPSKFQYNMAEANGLEPDSFGGEMVDDPRIAPYGQKTLLGPTIHGGIAPPVAGQAGGDHLWGYSLSTPQIDAITTLFDGVTIKPEDGIGNIGNTLFSKDGVPASLIGGQTSPLIGMPAKMLGIGAGNSAGQEPDGLQAAFDTLGAPTALARSLPNLSGQGTAYTSLFPDSKAAKASPEQQQSNQLRYLINAITGVKLQDYTSDGATKSANIEWGVRTKKLLRNAGITDKNDVDAMKTFLKERQGRTSPKKLTGGAVPAGQAGPPQ